MFKTIQELPQEVFSIVGENIGKLSKTRITLESRGSLAGLHLVAFIGPLNLVNQIMNEKK